MNLISHPANKGFDCKPLSEHLSNVAIACKSIIDGLDLDLTVIAKDALASLAFRIALLHDIGKGSEYFQSMIRSNRSKDSLSRHSLASAIIAYQDIINSGYPDFAAPVAFKLIQRHHGNLDSLGSLDHPDQSLLLQTRDILTSINNTCCTDPQFNDFMINHHIIITPHCVQDIRSIIGEISDFDLDSNQSIEQSFEIFLVTNLLFSALISSDKTDAARLDLSYSDDTVSILSYSPIEYIKHSTVSQTDSPLNQARQKFVQMLGSHDKVSKDTFSYTITAPTGIGKTLACMNFVNALQGELTRSRRVIYCLPYTSIIDQNYSIYRDLFIFNNPEIESELYKYIIRHHHLQDYYGLTNSDPDYDYWDYMNDLLVVESWTSACIVSTFVQLFHTLVGNRNSTLKKLHSIVNSIVILDEIQNIDPQYYKLLNVLFKVLASRFKTYVVLCTATQPHILERSISVELSDLNFFEMPLFNRVRLHYNSIPISLVDLLESITPMVFSSLLLVLNTKKAVLEAFRKLSVKYSDEYSVFCLTTYHIPEYRSSILDEIRHQLLNQKRVILVSTQLIEAGVDISFQLVFRDFAPLDNIIQSSGRCNRHGELGELGGDFYLSHITNDTGNEYASLVYNKYLLFKTKDLLRGRESFQSSDFLQMTQDYFASLDCDGLSTMVLNAIRNLNYSDHISGEIPIEDFKLIQDNYENCVVYILADPDIEKTFFNYINLRKEFSTGKLDIDRKNSIKLQLIRTYNLLKPYQLNLYASDIRDHQNNNPNFHKLSDHEYFIGYEHFDSAYTKESGFSSEVIEKYGLGQY